MKTLPIIFSAPMVVALLEGRKTQTRRLATSPLAKAEPGDLLWVREAIWQSRDDDGWTDERAFYRATDRDPMGHYWKARPPRYMPRWASRLTLEVTDKRFQRVSDLSPNDAVAEGVGLSPNHRPAYRVDLSKPNTFGADAVDADRPVSCFKILWDSLHTKPGTRWEDDPEVVALTFRVHQSNVDEMR